MNTHLVIFDLGNVLIRICDGWRDACRIAGVQVPVSTPERDTQIRPAIERIIAQFDTGRIDLQNFAQQIAAQHGMSPQDVVRLHDVYLRGPSDGAIALLDDLHAAGVATACLSNTSDHHWKQMLDPAGPNFLPLERMTWQFASHLIGMMKPHAGIYEHVERTTGVPPGSILFFDDLEANIAAAKERGWIARQIRTDAEPIPQVRSLLRRHGIL